MEAKLGTIQLQEIEEQQEISEQDQRNTLLQVKEVAELLGIHPNTVRIWSDSGFLKSYRIGPRKDRRIPLTAIKHLLKSG